MIPFLFLGMFALGFVESLRGPLLPEIRAFFGISYGAFGTVLAISSAAFLLGSLTAGPTLRRVGARTTLRTANILIACGLLVIGFSHSVPLFAAGLLLLGFGGGFFDLSINGVAGRAFARNPGLMMNLLHLLFGVGATVGPIVAGTLLARDFRWDHIYRMAIVLPLLALIGTLSFRRAQGGDGEGSVLRDLRNALRDRRVQALSISLGCFVAVEHGITTWLANYLVSVRGFETAAAATRVAWFYGLFSASRLLLGALTDRIGLIRVVRISTVLAVAMLLVGGSGPRMAWLLSATGIPVAVLFPTIMAHISRTHRDTVELVMAVGFTAAGLVHLVSNIVVGLFHDWLGTQIGFLSISAFGVLGLIAHVAAGRLEARRDRVPTL